MSHIYNRGRRTVHTLYSTRIPPATLEDFILMCKVTIYSIGCGFYQIYTHAPLPWCGEEQFDHPTSLSLLHGHPTPYLCSPWQTVIFFYPIVLLFQVISTKHMLPLGSGLFYTAKYIQGSLVTA